jgi:hypothetical protein
MTPPQSSNIKLDCAEQTRIEQDKARQANWKRWGPYLAERQWGTVREDYSEGSDSWRSFTHEDAVSRAYRWGEDGLLGITDRQGRLSFAVALWNGKDPILKERLFGLTGPEGNHGEDVKEAYYYLDSTPTHSYMKAMYKYPQAEFPYAKLRDENASRSAMETEFELHDTGVFRDGRFFDVVAEYAKGSPNDVLIRITVTNHGPDSAPLHLLPTLWYRNTWSHGRSGEGYWPKPNIEQVQPHHLQTDHDSLGRFHFFIEDDNGDTPKLLFTDNETNFEKLFDEPNQTPFVKDAFHRFVVDGEASAINPENVGTKVAPVYQLELKPGESRSIKLRLISDDELKQVLNMDEVKNVQLDSVLGSSFDEAFKNRIAEADEFYRQVMTGWKDADEQAVARQGFAGLLWTKQFYFYSVRDWLRGDPNRPAPPASRMHGRNSDWHHLYNRDIISMPDKWEYPWYAAWDLAFHMIPFARIDIEFAKEQLVLFLREWYMHPSGQIPAYEFNFSDVNPPVHAWAAWQVYLMSGEEGERDREFLGKVFHKLLINFTWWINRKDHDDNHIFSGGFLGLDNIGVFDRSEDSPLGGKLDQADATAWMAFYCTSMLTIALELARNDSSYEDVASKFFEHFMAIADAMNELGGGLWDEEDGFYYDQLHRGDEMYAMKVRSLVGLLPMVAVGILDSELIDRLPGFKKRMLWFIENRKGLASHITYLDKSKDKPSLLLAIPSKERLIKILTYLLDETEFLSEHGVRSLSKYYKDHPYQFSIDNQDYSVSYIPGESDSGFFGGNSNWRGPIWFPINFLIIESLEKYSEFYGNELLVECPTGSGNEMNLQDVAQELARRLAKLFKPDESGQRPMYHTQMRYANDDQWKDLILFYEYFHGDSGNGLGASHQTGWTALVINCLERLQGNDG